MIDLSDLEGIIEDFGSTYTVTRPGPTEFTSVPGTPTQGAGVTMTVTGVVQPVAARDLQRLAEGLRTEDARVFYTGTMLEAGEDFVALEGGSWQVESVEPWAIGAYYKTTLRRVETSD